MITNRTLTEDDYEGLQKALDNNTFHPNQTVADYVGDGKFTELYEDESGPIGVLRYTKVLRLVVTWYDVESRSRNAASIVKAIQNTIQKAKENGFTEVIFQSEVPAVINFCKKLGFAESKGEFVLYV